VAGDSKYPDVSNEQRLHLQGLVNPRKNSRRTKFSFPGQSSIKASGIEFHQHPSSASRVDVDGRTDMAKLISALRDSGERA